MVTYLYLAQIVVAIAVIAAILMQTKGANMGGIFGGEGSVYRSRRGVEKTLFSATIGLVVVFFLLALLTVVVAG
ncbi:MAG: preprotein translocase subunit SecG [Chloroflexi bacterium]|nr:preprotein translocase subunit SecG [Chloroflexota bacterium]